MNNPVVFGGAAGALLVLVALVLWRRRSSEKAASKRAHDEAQQRDAPVDMGETYEFGVTEFTEHHSGERVAVGKVEGFVLFTEDVPESVSKGDVVRATVTSFNRNGTSADAIYEGRA
ncbi:hypothetical protein [Halobacterium sp. R2-5]|uniref:TRAM domain-containing protein n=1 Tax=Halobacterium sp. R2-5 TaxID=2715751 RepID=UPI00141E8AD2|nr:hypothetical protein [Halobacterium sp. R2-5]NIB99442.1 hypothetical protein [Halobacterium sp. R2-5]